MQSYDKRNKGRYHRKLCDVHTIQIPITKSMSEIYNKFVDERIDRNEKERGGRELGRTRMKNHEKHNIT